MSADIHRRASMAGPQARAGGARFPNGPITAEAQRLDKIDNDEFERQAALYSKPDSLRPALLAADEVEKIRAGYGTGAGRLDVLVKTRNYREAYWHEQQGLTPFDRITPEQRAKAEAFFGAHGIRLADDKPQAPPNPIRQRDEQAKQAAAPAPSPAPSAAQAAPTVPPAAEAKPAPVDKPVIPLPPPAMLDIDFLSEQGFHCQLHLQASSWSGVLDQLGQATGRLAAMKAKPVPAAAPIVVPATGDQPKICAIHKTPMKENRFKWFCPEKDENQENGYCAYEIKKGARK